jgi:hypothetical protein
MCDRDGEDRLEALNPKPETSIRFVIERGHADGKLEGETAFTSWKNERAFPPGKPKQVENPKLVKTLNSISNSYLKPEH